MSVNYKDTLTLPKTEFPMRANLVKREPQRIEHWEKIGLYDKIQQKNAEGSPFILHDGPPFTNGDVHIGTALNKILKDIILRFKSLNGFKTPYMPGWDCHGLPIEHKVTRELREAGKELSTSELREACAEFSRSFMGTQRKQFRRLGVMADWDNEYRTLDPAYEADILRTFAAFIEQGLVYRSKKPVYWSIPCETALAEAEIEYADHVSPSIWVKFPMSDPSALGVEGDVGIVIWTTTPWTLPANLAVAVHPRLNYVVVKADGQQLIVAEDLLENFSKEMGYENVEVIKTFVGQDLDKQEARHPFIDRPSPIVLAEYVTTESGTGCVHTAPGHGLEDYMTGLNYGLDIYCPLDDKGCYVDDGQVPAELVGVSVLEKKGRSPANVAVLKIIEDNGSLLKFTKFSHSYPHCWRSKTPVIFRAMDQWFVSMEKNDLRKRALEAISTAKWVPSWGENRIRGAVENRPDWCISRQRSWGVPIPAFYDEEGEAYLDATVVRALADKVESAGTNIWFEQDASALLDGIDLPENWDAAKLKTGRDTLDVWIDSGSSHQAVLKRREGLSFPADLYLEGSDQHRGWFQSSLWTAMVTDGKPPYKEIVTHGFIVKEDGTKISKSDTRGKPQTADAYIKNYGADVIRLWISSQDYRNDIPVSDNILKRVVDTYRLLRNTLRFQLSNLFDFDYTRDGLAIEDLNEIDRWVLNKTAELVDTVNEAYQSYEFHRAYQAINQYFSVTLSALYHDVLKDRLYTLAPDDQLRRSSQTAIYHIFRTVTPILSPILLFTTDEAWSYFKADQEYVEDSVHLCEWPEVPANWKWDGQRDFDALLEFRSRVNEQLEKARQAKAIGKSLDASVSIAGPSADAAMFILDKYSDLLPEIFIVSNVTLEKTDASELSITVKPASGERCPRCWRRVERLISVEQNDPICPRCSDALNNH